MNKFKFFRTLLIAVTFISAATIFNACTESGTEGCDLISCENGGTCIVDQFGDAVCECPEGFSGPECSLIDCILVECPPNSTCREDGSATCDCNPGYEAGTDPATGEQACVSSAGRFVGNYVGTDVCALIGESPSYECTITQNVNDESQLLLNNLGGFNLSVKADMTDIGDGIVRFDIPIQSFTIDGGDLGIIDLIFEGTSLGTVDDVTGDVGVSYKNTCVGCDNGANIVDECDAGLVRM